MARSAKGRARVGKVVPKQLAERKGEPMILEYLLAVYKDARKVFANEIAVGVTNHILLLPPGDYVITLDGSATTPPQQPIELDGTSPVHPCVVVFT